jgi:enamine deaminase RidA (YjgF/YER057c/UK114 family)
MSGIEVKAIENLAGTPVSYAYAVKAGPWVFLTGHEAFDWATGEVDAAVAGPAGFPSYGRHHASRREADFVLKRMQGVLREFGTDLAHSIRLDQYYPNPRAVAAYHLSRHENFKDYIPPSTSVVMERLFSSRSTISTSMIAVLPEPGYDIRKVHPPGVASAPTSGFVPAVVCNEFVFVAGQMAHNPGTGLDPRAVVPDHAAWAGIPIRRQTEFLILEKLKPALEAAGSSLEQSVKAQIYLADIADAPDCLDVWDQHYAGIPCAVTAVPTKSFATVGGIIEINLIALTNAATRKKEVIEAGIPGMATHGPCIKAGEFLLPSGLMAIGRDGVVASGPTSPRLAAWRTPATAKPPRFTATLRRCARPPERTWASCCARSISSTIPPPSPASRWHGPNVSDNGLTRSCACRRRRRCRRQAPRSSPISGFPRRLSAPA